jgi:protein gp37
MGDRSNIEWCHATINAISGCSVVSPGCKNCYAMRAGAHNRPHHPSRGLTRRGSNGQHVWTGAVRLNEDWLKKPLKWAKPRRIFWNAHGDPFHPAVPREWVDRELAIAALTPHHRHLILTKRPDRMRAYFTDPETIERVLGWARHFGLLPDARKWQWPLPNVWLGTSVEDQPRANERIPELLATPAALHWLSCEPLLQPVDLTALDLPTCTNKFDAFQGMTWALQAERYGGGRLYSGGSQRSRIRWIVAGGESGLGARSIHADAFTSLRDQCATAGIPFLFKQWGEWIARAHLTQEQRQQLHGKDYNSHTASVRLGRKAAGRLLDGRLHDAYPELFKWESEAQRKPACLAPAKENAHV